ncbi:hypothetical protein ACFPT7_21500 [Acidicapsa dinghuensis]|uniref:Uncharacterized protein n=1 Tax=Acidicapsa dinghuensis TaxID=2218256 RepID=A0ABW1EPN2_9BACT|nr:hypothetical protein [Acidicapsa dinghuensis]
MFNSNILDVAIGLVFLFLMLSLICSAANEILEIAWKQRSKQLERGIKELLGDNDNALVSAIYSHGLINGLFRGTYQTASRNGTLPSYIPAKNFAMALIDLMRTGTVELSPNVKEAVRAFGQVSDSDLVGLQQHLEDWYNCAMDRVSGWYKRRSQTVIVVLAILVTVLLNADCVQVAKRLSTDPNLRQTAVQLAVGADKNHLAATTDEAATTQQSALAAIGNIQKNIGALDGIGLPIGWQPSSDRSIAGFFPEAGQHWLGWLLTVLAISLGAPFWFDVLNKIIVVRSTVKPTEKSKEEGSKDVTGKSAVSADNQ